MIGLVSARCTNLSDKAKEGLAKYVWSNKLNWATGNETRECDRIKELALDRTFFMAQECKERVIMALATGMGFMGVEGYRGFKFLMFYLVNQPKPLSA